MNNILKCCGYNEQDISIVRGEGDLIFDDKGRGYVDFEAGVWSASLGHAHPRVNAVIKAQADRIMHLGYQYRSPVVEEAAARVLDAVGIKEGKCIFLASGSESVEFGVQCIRRLRQQPQLLSLAGAYLAAYGSAGKRSAEEWYFIDWSGCTSCVRDKCGTDCSIFREIPFERIGGLVFEPGNTSGLVKLPPLKLVKALEAGVRKQGGLIMANEVTTGFGRTGKWFGYEHYELQPDIVSMGKSIGSGYPVSAVALKAETAYGLEQTGFRYAQSHQNDALGCAVAMEVIKVIKEEGMIERSAEIGCGFRDKLEQLAQVHDCIREVRGRGLMLALEFMEDKKQSLAWLHDRLFEEGFLTGYNITGNLLRFYPPLVIRESSIDGLLTKLDLLLEVS